MSIANKLVLLIELEDNSCKSLIVMHDMNTLIAPARTACVTNTH